MSTDDYAPFDAPTGEEVACYHDDAADCWGKDTERHQRHTRFAAWIRNALACYAAQGERCLQAEVERDQARRAS